MSGPKLNVEPLKREQPGASEGFTAPTVKLLVPLEFDYERDWLRAFDLASPEFSVAALSIEAPGDAGSGYRERQIHREPPLRRDLELPSFSDILQAFHDEQPDACLILAEGVLGRLVMLAADLLGVAIFSLVVSHDQLENMPKRRKRRPDLFFLGDSELFAAALHDTRYGTTVLPAGHPERDLIVRGEAFADRSYDDPRYGDGQAAQRMIDAIRRWRDGTLAQPQPELSVVVPAYRESANVALVCDRLLALFETEPITSEILVIDDASPDDTYAQALHQMWRSPRIRAFTKGTPRGMGNAIIRGLQLARSPFIAITMGDGSDEVSRIPEMLRKVRDEGYSLAIGSRYGRRENYENVPRLYRFWSACFRLTTRVLVGVRLKDYTNAFRLFNRQIFARYGPEGGGFEISPEITFKAWFATGRVTEVDVRHLKRASGQSTFSFLRAGPGYGKMLIKAFVNRLTGYWFSLDW
jgi:hypothetical protein